jgi:outer membrane protein
MSGPVIGSNNLGTAWGSAVGGLVTWEPFDFGCGGPTWPPPRRPASPVRSHAQAHQFEVAVAAADAYLTLVAAQETVRAAGRAWTAAKRSCAPSGRWWMPNCVPARIASRAEAELAAARTELIQAQQAVEVARAMVSQLRGHGAGPTRHYFAPQLLQPPPEEPSRRSDTAAQPHGGGAERRGRTGQGTAPGARAILLPTVLSCKAPRMLAAPARKPTAGCSGGLNGLAPSVQDYALGFR